MEEITLSSYTNAFLDTLEAIKKKKVPPEAQRLTVSPTVSFFAILYERVRNAVEFREEHLIRRAAIERILKRRLSLNPEGRGEGENLIRELLWARYLPSESVIEEDVEATQKIIDKYIYLRRKVIAGRASQIKKRLANFVYDLMTCELEEFLSAETAQKNAAHLHFFYQVLKNKVEIKEASKEDKDAYFYTACEAGFAKSDPAYIRYHLFKLSHSSLFEMKRQEIDQLVVDFVNTVDRIDKTINNPYRDKLTKFVRRHVPPFLIFFTIADRFPNKLSTILTNKKELWKTTDSVCREKYQETGKKLRIAAVRSVIYIFLTKMLFALALEYPLSKYFYGQVEFGSLTINTLFPPFLMGAIVSFFHVPGEGNTGKIYHRIIDILNRDPSFETAKQKFSQRVKIRRPFLIFGFTVFYLFTFGVTFALIYYLLDLLQFNLVSKLIFIFFVSIITFFGYRIKQTTKEYTLEEKESIFTPLFDFFFMPILSLGKYLSQELAKLNIFILIFDFLIEAPFKLIFEIVEEWIAFVRARKEEIV